MSESPTPPADYRNLFETALTAAKAVSMKPIDGPDGRKYAPVPKGFELKPLEDDAYLHPHAAARIDVDEKQALIDYVNRFREPGTVIFADVDAGAVSAVLDYHLGTEGKEDCAPGARQHVANLKLRFSEEFERWNKIAGELLPQTEFALFLEENAGDIAEPEPAAMIELARDFAATADMKFSSRVDLTNADRTFHYENETKVDERIKVPKHFALDIPIYQGEDPITLKALFRYRVAGAGMMLGFDWHRVVYQQLALFKEIAFAVAEGTGAPVYLGRRKD